MPGDYLTRPELRERGWTDGLIKRLLGEPDKLSPNPHYRSGPKMVLYLLSRVESIEAKHQEVLDDAGQKRARRHDAAQKAVKTKRLRTKQKSLAAIKPLERLPLPELVQCACDSYNKLPLRRKTRQRDDWEDDWDYREKKEASPDSDRLFLDRICVNYLRHVILDYDVAIDQTEMVGGREVYQPVRRKVFVEIARAYTELAEECRRQEERRR